VLAEAKWSSNDTWTTKNLNCEDKWLQLLNHFNDQNISISNLCHVAEYIFCLPGTSAPVEQVFSVMNNGKRLNDRINSESPDVLQIKLVALSFTKKCRITHHFLKGSCK
jgi:hypothetical protein